MPFGQIYQISSQTIQTNEQSQFFPMLGIWKTWSGFLCIITFVRWAAGGITSGGTKLTGHWRQYVYYTLYRCTRGSDAMHCSLQSVGPNQCCGKILE